MDGTDNWMLRHCCMKIKNDVEILFESSACFKKLFKRIKRLKQKEERLGSLFRYWLASNYPDYSKILEDTCLNIIPHSKIIAMLAVTEEDALTYLRQFFKDNENGELAVQLKKSVVEIENLAKGYHSIENLLNV